MRGQRHAAVAAVAQVPPQAVHRARLRDSLRADGDTRGGPARSGKAVGDLQRASPLLRGRHPPGPGDCGRHSARAPGAQHGAGHCPGGSGRPRRGRGPAASGAALRPHHPAGRGTPRGGGRRRRCRRKRLARDLRCHPHAAGDGLRLHPPRGRGRPRCLPGGSVRREARSRRGRAAPLRRRSAPGTAGSSCSGPRSTWRSLPALRR